MDVVADVVAGYAAVVGTTSLVWQILSARRARQPGVTVSVMNAIVGYDAVHTVCVKVSNREGQRAVGVSSAGLDLQDGSGRTYVHFRKGPVDSIPGTVEPHHALSAYFEVSALEEAGFDLKRALTGFVNLETGDTVRSEPTTLRI
jgi:hypothetical protein